MFPISQPSWQRLLFSTSSFLLLCALVTAVPGAALASSTTTPETVVETGDALAGTAATTVANTTEIDTNASSTPDTDDTATTSPPLPTLTTATTSSSTAAADALVPNVLEAPLGTTTNSNHATSTTNATTLASTGTNVASSTGNATIATGDAVAYSDVLNVLNTTIVDATGLIQFINNVVGIGDFDLTNQFTDVFAGTKTAQSTPPCSLAACAAATMLGTSTNAAAVVNNVVVTADTGTNGAAGANAAITTGNAYASANVINVANTNIVDSQYLLLVFNDFSDHTGNLILPNSSFFSQLFSNTGSPTTVSASNTAIVNNTVHAVADSGGNVATGTDSTVATGNATAIGTVANTINQNIIGSNAFSMVIRVFGEWSGSIYGLPDGMSWENTPAGIRIFTNPPGGGGGAGAEVATENSASINNNVQVFALTGDNYAEGGSASVSTGNAYANASIMNLVNTNIIGSNWASLIFNIYGNWGGSLSFGESDLWVGVRATSPDTPVMPGSHVTYTYTIFNHGDLTAHNLELVTEHEQNALGFAGNEGTTQRAGELDRHTLAIGSLAPGETREIVRTATVNNRLPEGTVSAIPLKATITGDEPDSDESNNSDTVTITVGQARDGSGIPGGRMGSNVRITKTANTAVAEPGDTVTYAINVTNSAGTLFDAVLVDILEAADGTIVNEQFVPLDDLATGATLDVSYDVTLSDTIATGTYTNTAQVIGFEGSTNIKYQQSYSSPIATHTLTVGTSSGPIGQVLGASDSCTPYLTQYLRQGQVNDAAEVVKLQTFLNRELGSGLSPSGRFDRATELAVRAFQSKYAQDVLAPWQATTPTGYVYYTTRKKINERHCSDTITFPLTPAQRLEIARVTTTRVETPAATVATVPATRPRTTEEPTSVSPAPARPTVEHLVATSSDDEDVGSTPVRSLFNRWLLRAVNIFSVR